MPRIYPVYLFTGNDEYLKKEAVEKLKKALLGKDKSEAFNFAVYDLRHCDIREVIDSLRSMPFISGKRLIVLKHAESATQEKGRAILAYAQSPSENACLVLESSKGTLSGQFYLDIKRSVREVSFEFPKKSQVADWIRKELRTRGKSIDHNAVHLINELKGGDPASLRSEIEKLVVYSGSRHTITKDDVIGLVGNSASRSVFEFVNALSRKDAKGALTIARELSAAKKTTPEILGMIGWQFRRMRKAKRLLRDGASDSKAGAECNIPPFYMQRFMKEIQSFSEVELEENIDSLLKADLRIKRGISKGQDALELLIFEVCGGR